MKNNIEQKIINRFSEITISETPSVDIFERIKNNINKSENTENNKRIKFLLKPVLAAAVFIVLTVTVAAAAPLILKMLGSDIGFFDSDNQTRYSADHEIIKQYSSEVGITAEGGGFKFTVDNIAYDGVFLSVFYTVTKDTNIYEETKEQIKNWSGAMRGNDNFIIRAALWNNEIHMKIPGYIDEPNYETHPVEMHDTLRYPIIDGYFASDYELKGMYRYTIPEDLPDIFDVEISYQNYPYSYDGYLNRLRIPLTIDISESRIEKLVVTPNISAVTVQRSINYAEGLRHDITIDRVSISPLGNVLVFTEKGGDDELNNELFNNYFIIDNKGNFYGKAERYYNFRENWEKDTSVMVEFYGDVPSDAEYLKLIPYNASTIPEITGSYTGEPEDYIEPDPREYYLNSKADISDLPYSFEQNEYGNVIIESCVVTEQDITVIYKYNGMVIPPFIVITDGDKSISPAGQLSVIEEAVYNRITDSYTQVWLINKPVANMQDTVKGLKVVQQDIELLKEQAVIISLK